MQDSGTTADLRGIVNVGNGTAWASGTHGTVLRTEDSGFVWQGCTVPPGAEKLDFRGVQAFDDQTALVMSSGKGDLSRVYKTTDGCKSWKLVFTNPDADGFFDALVFDKRHRIGILVGDPVKGRYPTWKIDSADSALQVQRTGKHQASSEKSEGLFAASNSSVFVEDPFFLFWIATGGKNGARVIRRIDHDFDSFGFDTFPGSAVPVGSHTESSGIFSLSFRPNAGSYAHESAYLTGIAVGGDYKSPESSANTAARTEDGGKHWQTPQSSPHGYRSSVAYDAPTKTWITVGPNGTDISTDDGRNWQALKPGYGDDADADKRWNALSLPYVVGPHGRIGRLRDDALAAAKTPH